MAGRLVLVGGFGGGSWREEWMGIDWRRESETLLRLERYDHYGFLILIHDCASIEDARDSAVQYPDHHKFVQSISSWRR